MLNTVSINLKTDIQTDGPTTLPIRLMSQDKNNNQFILRFTNGGESVTLDDTYTIEVLTKFTKSGTSRLTTAKVRQNYASWEFDTSFITMDEKVTNYVYVRKAGSLVVSADANAFAFDVGLSEIDKDAGRVAEVYDENYQKYLDEFKDNVNFEEIAQAEQARKEAEILRQENYDAKVDTAIVEADVVEKVDNKVTELTPQINSLTAQLAQKVNKSEHRNIYISKNEPMGNVGDIWLKPAPSQILYDRGFEFIEWEQGQILEELGGTNELDKSWDGITLLSQTSTLSSSTSQIALITKTPIDLTNLSELGIEYDGVLDVESPARSNVAFRVSEKDNKEGYVLTTGLFEEQNKATLNVSYLTGLHYIKIRTYANTEVGSRTEQLSKVRVLKVWGD